jgi:hypothetical protein
MTLSFGCRFPPEGTARSTSRVEAGLDKDI